MCCWMCCVLCCSDGPVSLSRCDVSTVLSESSGRCNTTQTQVNTFSPTVQLTVSLSLSICFPGCLCGAVRQTGGVCLQLLLALHQDRLWSGCTGGRQPHHRSVSDPEVKETCALSAQLYFPHFLRPFPCFCASLYSF